MATARRARPEQAPDDLASKRPAAALSAVKAETRAEQKVADDGSVEVTLSTRNGFHDFQVPPYDEWSSVARNALNRNDDLTWAQQTLPVADAVKWMNLNPNLKDVGRFFDAWSEKLGQSLGE